MRWILRSGLKLAVALGMASALTALVPADRLARVAADRLEAATGRTVAVGTAHPVLWPYLGLRAERIAVSDLPWAGRAPMLTATAADVELDLPALLRGGVRIRSVRLDGARLRLVRRADGVGNWTMGGEGVALPVARVSTRGAVVTVADRARGRDWQVEAVDLDLVAPPARAHVLLSGSALVGGIGVEAEARIADLGATAAGRLAPVAVAIRSGASTLSFEGRADLDPLSFEGALRADSLDGFASLRARRAGSTVEPMGLRARATLAPDGGLHLRGMAIEAPGTAIVGAVDVLPGADRPIVTASLTVGAARLPGLEPTASEPIDLAPLFALDGTVAVAGGPVTLGGAVLDEIDATVAIEAGRAVATLRSVSAFGGTGSGEVVLNGRGGLSARARMTARDVDLSALTGASWLSGRSRVELDLEGAGESVAALIAGLRGTARAEVAAATVTGIDLAGAARDGAGATGPRKRTEIGALDLVASVADGSARIERLTFAAPPFFVEGTGRADLVSGALDARLELGAADASRVPLAIGGPWSSPRFAVEADHAVAPDPSAAAGPVAAALRSGSAPTIRRAKAPAADAAAAIREGVAAQLLEVLGER